MSTSNQRQNPSSDSNEESENEGGDFNENWREQIDSDHPEDPNNVYTERAVEIGRFLGERAVQRKLASGRKAPRPIRSYADFLRETSRELGVSRQTIKRSLKRIDLWRKGQKGKKGGRQLGKMMDDLIDLAMKHVGGDRRE
jgi:hypothetical protein